MSRSFNREPKEWTQQLFNGGVSQVYSLLAEGLRTPFMKMRGDTGSPRLDAWSRIVRNALAFLPILPTSITT
jgi:hypothetical protein